MHLLEYQVVLGIIATIIGLAGYAPYFKDIIKRTVKPHAFSWLIWGISQSTVFFASASKGGGAGTWAVGAPALLDCTIFVVAVFRGEKEITLIDKGSLVSALFGIALWVITTNPLWSVITLSAVDAIGFIPTMRKAYKRPREESVIVYVATVIAFGVSVLALGAINLTTVLYPVSVCFTGTSLVILIITRRRSLDRKPRKGRK